jgi:REP element-mobilizing transposase RayT
MHCVFSTSQRHKIISQDLQSRLWPFLGGIARENKIKALAVGGTDDHAHLLLSLPTTIPVAKAIQLIKGGSSRWIHETFPTQRDFAWQEGYGAFSVGVSQVEATIAYIQNQREHHRKKSFEEEFLAFLEKHGIEYDKRHVLG